MPLLLVKSFDPPVSGKMRTLVRPGVPSAEGYAGIIIKVLGPLDGKAAFKKRFKGIKKRIMMDSPYWRHAVAIAINDGRLAFLPVAKSPRDEFLKERSRCDAFIEIPMSLLMAFVMGRKGIIHMSFHLMAGRIKAKGIYQLLFLLRMFNTWRSTMSSN